jgi:predicted choloylglycine hydrolase
MIIRKPTIGNPTVSVAAPGTIGTMTGINSSGVGVGVDMMPSANCNPEQAGLNSFLLTRWSIENGKNCDETVDVMVKAQRGVSYVYILADGITDKACIVEAGESAEQLNFLNYVEDWVTETIEKVYPQFKNLLKNPSAPIQNGLTVRCNNYFIPPSVRHLMKR